MAAEDRGGDKGRARADLAKEPSDSGACDKADAERGADEAKVARAFFRLGDIGDRGLGCRIAAAEDARQGARDEQPWQCLDDRQQRIVDREPTEREQQHAPPPEMVRQIAEDRRGKEGRNRHDEPDPRADLDRVWQVDPADLHHELRQHRHDDAEADRVHEDCHDNERDGPRRRHLLFLSAVPSATEPSVMRCR